MSQGSGNDDITRSHFQLSNDTIIGHYGIIEKRCSGGISEVYPAQDTALDRKVALKFPLGHLCGDADRQKFLAVVASTLPAKKQVKPSEFGAAIDKFAKDFHQEAEKVNATLRERVTAARANRLGRRRK